MKPTCIIIAGPMCAGKTTTAKILVKRLQNTLYHPEINQYTLMGKKHVGGAFVGSRLEKKINKANLERLRKITSDSQDLMHFIETDIFHCVFAKFLGKDIDADFYKKEYIKLYQKANVGLLFRSIRHFVLVI